MTSVGARARIAAALHQHPALRARVVTLAGPYLRARALLGHRRAALHHPLRALAYLVRGKETDNLLYPIANAADLVPVLASVLAVPQPLLAGYLAEIEGDTDLREPLDRALAARKDRENVAHLGRRVGWYMTVRALRPRLTIETGTHDGIGSAVLLRALERNAAEGAPGELWSFDINTRSGWLVDPQPPNWRPIIGDARETLPEALRAQHLDLFIHDSIHTAENERWELELALEHASPDAALITDNAHVTDVLRDLAAANDMPFGIFREQPVGHWYPGGALGVAARRESQQEARSPQPLTNPTG